MWAALESMAARLATLHASDADIATLRHLFDEFQNSPAVRASVRIFGCEHRLPYGGHCARRLADHRRCDPQPAHSCARHTPRDHHAKRSRRPLDHRSFEDHRGARAARHRTGRAAHPPAHARSRGPRRSLLRFSRLTVRLPRSPHSPLGRAWAVLRRRRAAARYCGRSAAATSPCSARGATARTPASVSGSRNAARKRLGVDPDRQRRIDAQIDSPARLIGEVDAAKFLDAALQETHVALGCEQFAIPVEQFRGGGIDDTRP